MSDLLRGIVNEVLGKGASPPSGDSGVSGSPVSGGPEGSSPGTVPVQPEGIRRPNYQREKAKQRLAPLMNGVSDPSCDAASPPGGSPSSSGTRPPGTGSSGTGNGRRPAEQTLSSLQRLSLFQVKTPPGNAGLDAGGEAKLIGRTKDGAVVWCYPRLHPRLAERLGWVTQGASAGVVTHDVCTPGQLFMSEDVLREETGLEYAVEWGEERGASFVLRITGRDPDRLEKVLKEMYLRFNRRAMRETAVYFSEAPSPLLTEKLKLDSRYPVAVLEGISPFHGIGLLDRVFKRGIDSPSPFRIGSRYLLLQGDRHRIQRQIDELKQEADRLA